MERIFTTEEAKELIQRYNIFSNQITTFYTQVSTARQILYQATEYVMTNRAVSDSITKEIQSGNVQNISSPAATQLIVSAWIYYVLRQKTYAYQKLQDEGKFDTKVLFEKLNAGLSTVGWHFPKRYTQIQINNAYKILKYRANYEIDPVVQSVQKLQTVVESAGASDIMEVALEEKGLLLQVIQEVYTSIILKVHI